MMGPMGRCRLPATANTNVRRLRVSDSTDQGEIGPTYCGFGVDPEIVSRISCTSLALKFIGVRSGYGSERLGG